MPQARSVGPGTKPRNFVWAGDVARLAVLALLEDPPPFRTLDIGGHDHLSNRDVAALYAREAGIALRASHLPAGLAQVMSTLASPLHPGISRILRLMSLPDSASDEHFDGAEALEQRFGLRLKRVEEFVREQVAGYRAAAAKTGL